MASIVKTRTIIWGQAGAHCSYPGCSRDLVMDASETDDESLVGDVAHIVAESPDGPRGASSMSASERNLAANLLLLCKIHHKLVDDQPIEYPIERLHEFKAQHVARVRAALSAEGRDALRSREIVASIVDSWTERIELDDWLAWTSWLLLSDTQSIEAERRARLLEMVQWLVSRVWPQELHDVRAAFDNFARVLNDLLITFNRYAERSSGDFVTRQFYRIDDWDEDRYHRLREQYDFHVDIVRDLVLELTRSTNLICDVVRRSLDPSFRMAEGILLVGIGPVDDLSFRSIRVEYRAGERTNRPYPGLKEFWTMRFERDFAFGERPVP